MQDRTRIQALYQIIFANVFQNYPILENAFCDVTEKTMSSENNNCWYLSDVTHAISYIKLSDVIMPYFFLVFRGLIFVLVYGILFYPYFACLTTEYRLIGSILGFIYAALR